MKKVLSILLTLVMLTSSMSNILVFANDTSDGSKITVEDTYAFPGGTVDVEVTLSNNPSIYNLLMNFEYDSTALKLIAVSNGTAMSDVASFTPPKNMASGCSASWYYIDEPATYKDGSLVVLTFEVLETAEAGESYSVSVTNVTAEDVDGTECDISVENGKVSIIDYIPGDVNGDGKHTIRKDVSEFNQYIVDGCKYDPLGYAVQINENAGDVNDDNKINIRDVIQINKYIVDGCTYDPNGYAVKLLSHTPRCQHTSLTAVDAKEASCTEEGNIAYWVCECGKYFSDDGAVNEIEFEDTVVKAGHTPATAVRENEVAGTCMVAGSYDEVVYCSICGAELSRTTKTIAKLGHTPGEATTCTTAQTCTACGEVLEAAKGHTPGANATCTEAQTCTVCGAVLESQNGHIPGAAATCTEPQRCTVCQTVLTEATGHSLTYVAEQDPVGGKEAADCVPGNCAYWQCSVCSKCYLDENATQEIALADTVWEIYLVYFFDLENDTYNVGAYKQSEVLSLKNISPDEMKGYDFNGWHTSENFTEQNKISVIPAGNTQNINLYANRILHKSKITLFGLGREEFLSYDIANGITLPTPKWKASAGEGDCLIFSHWTDEDGNKITEIPVGEIGDRTIEANWIYKENYAISNPNKYTYVGGYQNSDGKYSFIYEIGAIKNIVLSKQHTYTFEGLTEHTESETKTYTVGQSAGHEAATTVSNIVSSSSEMANIEHYTTTHEEGWELGAKWRPEIEFEGIKVSAWEFSGGYSNSDTDTYEKTGFSSENNYEENGTENGIRSTIDYYSEESVSRTVSDAFVPGVTPVGSYTWARLMDVKVYAIVTYNPYTGKYVFDVYSVPTNVQDGLLYTLPSSLVYEINIVSGDVLDFEIPFEEIPEKFYTVEYDANEGIGEMPKSIHELGVSSALFNNMYKRTGYTFIGWNTSADGSGTWYTDAANICDIAAAGETVTLYAKWNKNPYTVKYDANKPSNASSSVLNIPDNTDCYYDTTVTLGSEPTLTGWKFGGWYRDAACTETLKVGEAGEVKANANLTSEPNDTVPLYAKWTPHTYTITYYGNGATSGSTSMSTHTYDVAKNLSSNGFTRTNYDFLGWSTSSTATTPTYTNGQSVKNLTTTANGNINLYAVWVKIYGEYGYYSRNDEIWSSSTLTERFYVGFNKSVLKNNAEYKSISITMTVDAWENWVGMGVTPYFYIYNSNGVLIKHLTWDGELACSDFGNDWKTQELNFDISVDNLQNDGSILVGYSSKAQNNIFGVDTSCWHRGTVTIKATAKK